MTSLPLQPRPNVCGGEPSSPGAPVWEATRWEALSKTWLEGNRTIRLADCHASHTRSGCNTKLLYRQFSVCEKSHGARAARARSPLGRRAAVLTWKVRPPRLASPPHECSEARLLPGKYVHGQSSVRGFRRPATGDLGGRPAVTAYRGQHAAVLRFSDHKAGNRAPIQIAHTHGIGHPPPSFKSYSG